jgi:hypothetical protein
MAMGAGCVSYFSSVDPGVVAALDQRLASTGNAMDSVIKGTRGRCDTPVETYARFIQAIPDDMSEPAVRDWLCVALTKLAHAQVKVSNSEEGTV